MSDDRWKTVGYERLRDLRVIREGARHRDLDRKHGEAQANRSPTFIQSYKLGGRMSSDRQSVPVSLPSELVARLDRLVEDGVFGSRSEALRYGARLVIREEHLERLHEQTASKARKDVEERLDRKRVS